MTTGQELERQIMSVLYRARRTKRRRAALGEFFGGKWIYDQCIHDFLDLVHASIHYVAEHEASTWKLVRHSRVPESRYEWTTFAAPLDYRLQVELRITRHHSCRREEHVVAGAQLFLGTVGYKCCCTRALTTRRRVQLFMPPPVPTHVLCACVDREGTLLPGDHAFVRVEDWHLMERHLVEAARKVEALYARNTTPYLVTASL